MTLFGRRILVGFLKMSIFALGTSGAAHAQTEISDAAYPLLVERVTANRSVFFVYQDADSGFNHAFASGFFASPGNPQDVIELKASCLEDAASPGGCSSDASRLDVVRGTVMSISFDFTPGLPAEFAGVNFEEPENWGTSQQGVGYDLRGSENLVLDARSPGGISAQFGVAGQTSGFYSIPADWTTITIPLSTLAIPDLSDVHLLFTVVTNDTESPSGGTILLDNVRFEPVPDVRSAALSLPLSTESFGVLPLQAPSPTCVPLPLDQVLRNVTTIYESALTLFALLDRGLPQDLAAARVIADTFHYALHHDNQGDPLPAAPDGSTGLHNAYSSGDVALLNDQGPGAGQAGEVRLAGFSAGTSLCGPSGYCLVSDGATGGNAAFAVLALIAAYERLGETAYLDDGRTLSRWIFGTLADTSGTGFGGYHLGYPDEGVPPPKPRVDGKSIENNADIFVAFRKLAAVEEELGNAAEAALWTARADAAGAFVMEMFDPATGCFFAGTVPAGTTPSPGIDPSGPQRGNDVINVFPFFDANSFTSLALAKDPFFRNQIDWRQPAQCLLNHFSKSVTTGAGPTLEQFDGFSLVENPTCGDDGVAWEFTGQAVVTFRFIDWLYGELTLESQAQLYQDEIRQAQLMAPFGDGKGVAAGTVQDGDTLAPIDQCLSTPFQCIPERVGLAATTWAIFAERNANPLEPPCRRNFTLEHQAIGSAAVYEACTSLTAGPDVTVNSTGDLTLRAGSKIVFGSGFSVRTGGRLTAEIDPSLLQP
jgi:hypothetical protein